MKLFGKEPQEQAMQSLIHDTNRDIAQLDYVIKKLKEWLNENAKKMPENNINSSPAYVALEYLIKSSKDIKNDIDIYYKKFENDFKK